MLVSTDVLSEGLNLQDATRMINYDIHWNPVRLMQRIGRVDRRMDPEVEYAYRTDHPALEAERGTIMYWNFLPPDELNAFSTLYTRVTQKLLLISRTMGIEGKKLLRPEDDFEALKEFNQAYEGTTTAVEEMHLEYQSLHDETPGLERPPRAAARVGLQRKSIRNTGLCGVFFCFALSRPGQGGAQFDESMARYDALVSLRHRPRCRPRGASRESSSRSDHDGDATDMHEPRERTDRDRARRC